MRGKRLPLGFLAAGLLMVLAAIGIVNGLWSKNLVINGTVETGDLNVDWVVASSGDEFGPDDCTGGTPPWNPQFPCPAPDKDVGSMFCFIEDEDTTDTDIIGQVIHFEVHNAYPSYEADCEVEFKNTGSIPFNVVGFAIIPGAGLENCDFIVNLTQSKVLLCDELKIGYFDNVGLQVDPGDQLGSSLRIHLEQGADQSTCTGETTIFDPPGAAPPFPVVDPTCTDLVTYEFDVKVCVAQWNEDATFAECVDSLQHEGPPNGPGDGDGTPYYEDTEGPPGNSNGVGGTDDCTDGVDNDGDGDIDGADDGCVV
jgi:hypothetical protein